MVQVLKIQVFQHKSKADKIRIAVDDVGPVQTMDNWTQQKRMLRGQSLVVTVGRHMDAGAECDTWLNETSGCVLFVYGLPFNAEVGARPYAPCNAAKWIKVAPTAALVERVKESVARNDRMQYCIPGTFVSGEDMDRHWDAICNALEEDVFFTEVNQ